MVTCDGAGASHGLIERLDTLARWPGHQLIYSVGWELGERDGGWVPALVVMRGCLFPDVVSASAVPSGTGGRTGRSRALSRRVQFGPASAPGYHNDAVLPRIQAEL